MQTTGADEHSSDAGLLTGPSLAYSALFFHRLSCTAPRAGFGSRQLPEAFDNAGYLSGIFSVPAYFELKGIVMFPILVSSGCRLNANLFRTQEAC